MSLRETVTKLSQTEENVSVVRTGNPEVGWLLCWLTQKRQDVMLGPYELFLYFTGYSTVHPKPREPCGWRMMVTKSLH